MTLNGTARDETYDALARLWSQIVDTLEPGWGELDTDVLWEMALDAGLAKTAAYVPETHGEMNVDAEEGDTIYILTELGMRAIGRANDLRREREAKEKGA